MCMLPRCRGSHKGCVTSKPPNKYLQHGACLKFLISILFMYLIFV